MIEFQQVDIPAECRITFEQRTVTADCMVRLEYKDGYVVVLFKNDYGVIGYGGIPTNGPSNVRVNALATDGTKSITTTGSCRINGADVRISCSARLENSYVTVDARGW